MNERRRFGRLELIFVLMAAAYIGFIIYSGNSTGTDERAAEVTVEVPRPTATVDEPVQPTPYPAEVFTLGDLRRLANLEQLGTGISPDDALVRARLHHAAGDIASALADYGLVLAAAPDNTTARREQGDIYAELGLYDAALTAYTAVIADAPDSFEAYQALIGRATVYRAQGDAEAAIRDLSAAYRTDVISALDAGDVAYTLGQMYLEIGDEQRALDWLNDAVEINDRQPDYRVALARLQAANGNTAAAKTHYDVALVEDPFNVEARLWRAGYLAERGDPNGALTDYTVALRADGTNVVGLRGRAALYAAREQHERAIADYTVALVMAPEDGELYAARGAVYLDMGLLAPALEDLNAALEWGVADPAPVHNDRALVHGGRGDTDAALADYGAALDLLPAEDEGDVLFNRGSLYYRNGAYSAASADFERAVQVLPDDPQVWLLLGDTYAAQGARDAALAAYETHLTTSAVAGVPPVLRASAFVESATAPTEPAVQDPQATRYGHTTAAVNARTAASVTASVAFELPANSRVIVLGEEEGYYRVAFAGDTGYVRTDLIVLDAPVQGVGLISVSISLWDSPLEDQQRLASLPEGERVEVLGINDSAFWLYVEVAGSGLRGWVPEMAVRTSVDRHRLPITRADAPTGVVTEAPPTAPATDTPTEPAATDAPTEPAPTATPADG